MRSRREAAVTDRQARAYLPSRRASPPFGQFQIIGLLLLGDTYIRVHVHVNNLPTVVT